MSQYSPRVTSLASQQHLLATAFSSCLFGCRPAGWRVLRLLLCAVCLQMLAITSVSAAPAPAHQPAATSSAKIAQSVAKARPDVNINKAGAAELAESLLGVGPAKAQAIIAWRTSHGAFKSLEDLGQVKGIGAATLAKNKSHIHF